MEVSEAERQEVVSRCKDFLSNVWEKVNDEQIECHRITSGVANKTFHVWIKDLKISEKSNENHDVIVRFYNSGIFKDDNKIKFNGEVAEIIVHQRLFELGLAPKILGVFNGGRIEEYIPSRITTADDLKSLELSKEVIRKLAHFHTLSMPIPKIPNFMEKLVSSSVFEATSEDCVAKYPNEIKEVERIISFPLKRELHWIQRILPKFAHKIVFSHNELNPNNILLKENTKKTDDRLLIIDYELSSYFYRAYDLAYFLRMKRSRIEIQSGRIVFTFDEDDPSATDALLSEYLNEYNRITESDFDPKYDTLERFRMEVEFFDLVFDVFMVSMLKCIMLESPIAFPLDLCFKIVCEYEPKKQSVYKKYGDLLHFESD